MLAGLLIAAWAAGGAGSIGFSLSEWAKFSFEYMGGNESVPYDPWAPHNAHLYSAENPNLFPVSVRASSPRELRPQAPVQHYARQSYAGQSHKGHVQDRQYSQRSAFVQSQRTAASTRLESHYGRHSRGLHDRRGQVVSEMRAQRMARPQHSVQRPFYYPAQRQTRAPAYQAPRQGRRMHLSRSQASFAAEMGLPRNVDRRGPPTPPVRGRVGSQDVTRRDKFQGGRFGHNNRRNHLQSLRSAVAPSDTGFASAALEARPSSAGLLPTFTFADTPAEVKEAAHAAGRRVRASHMRLGLKLRLDDIIARDKEAYPDYYEKYGYEFELLRRVFYRKEYERKVEDLRQKRFESLIVLCYDECKGHVGSSFAPPTLPASRNPGLVLWLKRMGMKPFLATLLSLPTSSIAAVREENCPQWEANFQCLYACTGDLQLIADFKRLGLSGDAALTVNEHCPRAGLTEELGCVTSAVQRWLLPCEAALGKWEAGRARAMPSLNALRSRLAAAQAGRAPRAVVAQLGAQEDALCAAYARLLHCALPPLASACSPRIAAFLHTSLTASFKETFLVSKGFNKGQHTSQRLVRFMRTLKTFQA